MQSLRKYLPAFPQDVVAVESTDESSTASTEQVVATGSDEGAAPDDTSEEPPSSPENSVEISTGEDAAVETGPIQPLPEDENIEVETTAVGEATDSDIVIDDTEHEVSQSVDPVSADSSDTPAADTTSPEPAEEVQPESTETSSTDVEQPTSNDEEQEQDPSPAPASDDDSSATDAEPEANTDSSNDPVDDDEQVTTGSTNDTDEVGATHCYYFGAIIDFQSVVRWTCFFQPLLLRPLFVLTGH